MGNVVEKIEVKSIMRKKPLSLNVYFDSGSPFTFISESKAKKLGGVMKLPEPTNFSGLGDGKFKSNRVILLYFDLLGIWCKYLVFVVSDDITGNDDILAGHDFMQLYNIKLDLKKRRIVLDKKSLLRAQVIRRVYKDYSSKKKICLKKKDKIIEEIVKKIVQNIKPEKIIL